MLKSSRFNFTVRFNDEMFLLYNGITGAMYELSPMEKNELDNLLETEELSENLYSRENLIRLLFGGVIVPKGIDEVKIILDRAANECENHRMLELTVAPTYACNFRCVYCDNEFPVGKMSEEVERRVAAFVSKVVSNYDHINLSWYGGEPLLCMETVNRLTSEIRKTCEINGKTMGSFIATNGYLLDRESARKLVESGVTHFHITIDGTQQFHDSLRVLNGGGATFNRILENLSAILDNESAAKLTLRMNLNEKNIDSARDLMSFIPKPHRHRVKLSLAPIICSGHKTDPVFLKEINHIIKNGLYMGFQYQDSTISTGYATPCHADKRGNFQITPDGRLSKCTPSHDSPEADVGILDEDGAPLLNESFVRWNSAPWIREHCADCKFLCFCRGGCHLMRLRNSNSLSCRTKYQDIENTIMNKYINLTSSENRRGILF